MDEGPSLPEDRFNALMGRALRKEDRERLAKVRNALGIRANDAVWDVMIALDYHLQLYSAVPKQLAAEREKLVAELDAVARGVGREERGPGRMTAPNRATYRIRGLALRCAGARAGRDRGGVRRNLHRRRLRYGRARSAAVGRRGSPGRGVGGAGGLAGLPAAPARGGAVGAGGLGGGALARGIPDPGGGVDGGPGLGRLDRCGPGGVGPGAAPLTSGSSGSCGRAVGPSPSKTFDRSGGRSASGSRAGRRGISSRIWVKPRTPTSRSNPSRTHALAASSLRREGRLALRPCPAWRPGGEHSAANDAIIAVPIEMFVQASRKSVGARLKRAAHVTGTAMRPSPGRPPFSDIDAASSSAWSAEARSSWVASET